MNIDEFLKNKTPDQVKAFWKRESDYDSFMKQYQIDHKCCPECGETSHISTLVGYIFNHESPESYKDKNRCTCKCGSVHIAHERVPKK